MKLAGRPGQAGPTLTLESTNACQTATDGISDEFEYLEHFNVIVCRTHASAVRNLDTHLRSHHVVSAADRRVIMGGFDGLWVKEAHQVKHPSSLREPIASLGKPLNGFQCSDKHCGFITINIDGMRMHCKRSHGTAWRGDTDRLFRGVRVQTLFRTGQFRRYFVIRDQRRDHVDQQVVQQSVDDENSGEVVVDSLMVNWKVTQAEQEVRMQVLDADVAKTDKTGWWNRTGWTKHLAKRNLHHLARSVRLPDKKEQRLKRAAKTVECLIEQGVAGLPSLPRETRRWLRSAKREEADARPLARLQNPETQARYAGYIVMFVCHALRLVEDEERRRDDGSELDEESSEDDTDSDGVTGDTSDEDGLREQSDDDEEGQTTYRPDPLKDARTLFPWHGQQKELARELWVCLELDDEKTQIVQMLRLLTSFIFQGTGSNPFGCGLIHFTALLGIDAQTGRLRTAKNYSFMLAGIAYCLRILAVESLLPSAQREEQTDQDRDNFLQKRRDFLADASFSPMSEVLSLLAYGKHVAMTQGNSGNAFWSFDKKIFHLNGRPIVVRRFQQMVRDVITEVEDTFWQLLWIANRDQRFAVKLEKIVDDVSFTKRGASFVQRPENELHEGLRWMLSRALKQREGRCLGLGQDRRNIGQIKRYVRRVRRWLELLLAAVHFSSGQPGRGTEITTMRRINGVLQDRNIFIVDGQVMTVVRYHKSQSQWDKPKIVPRFLPWRLGQIMVLYLAYLQPFYEYLSVSCLGYGFDDYLWADEHGPWGTERLTRVIKRETGKRLEVALTTLDYRHVSVGIGRVVVGEGFSRGYEDEIGEVEELEVDEVGESALELQSARSTVIGLANYSVQADIVKHLSIRSIDTFRPLSELWHKFLGLASRQQDKEVSTEEVSASGDIGIKRSRDDAEQLVESVHPMKIARVTQEINVDRGIATAMQRVLGRTDVAFKSPEQEQAVHAIVKGQSPLVVVLPTGGGKSLLFMLPACLEDAGVTVVVVPLRALITDLVERMKEAGIECIEWRHGQVNPAAVVVVSADVAGEAGFMTYAGMLSGKKLLRRVVLDECHLTFTASHWRTRLVRLRTLRVLSCQFIFLTATLPPMLEQELADSMLVRCASYIRAGTVRANIRYLVSHCQRGKTRETTIGICRRQRRRLTGGLKGVVYCNSKKDCEAIAEELGCLFYHADVIDREERVQNWLKHGGLITATSALGTGVDFPGIVLIVHAGVPWSMIDYAQESGRGGRGGELVDSVIVVEEGAVGERMLDGNEGMDALAMCRFVEMQGCRRGMMSEYLDGKRVECGDVESAGCDKCGEGLWEWNESNRRWEEEWERVRRMLDELTKACGVCWVLGFDDEGWRDHEADGCFRHGGQMKQELARFRGLIRYGRDSHECRKCGISQAYCVTGEDEKARCQWGHVLVPVVRAGIGLVEGIRIIRSLGFKGEFEGDFSGYGGWLGLRHSRNIWGKAVSNGMATLIGLVLFLTGGREGVGEEV